MSFIAASLESNKILFNIIRSGALSSEMFIKNEVGAGGDKSAGIDLLSEDIFFKHLESYGEIISEESGVLNEGDLQIYLDPIDGSDNFLSGFPYYGTSVALCDGDKTLESVVCNLANGDCYIKDKDGLRYLNLGSDEYRNYNSRTSPYVGILEKPYSNIEIAEALSESKMKFRSPGAIALSLAYSRNVNFVIFGGKIREYDVRAGLHLSEGLFVHRSDNFIVVAKQEEIYEKILDFVKKD